MMAAQPEQLHGLALTVRCFPSLVVVPLSGAHFECLALVYQGLGRYSSKACQSEISGGIWAGPSFLGECREQFP